MSQFITGSDFGGPSVPNEYRDELANIINQMEDVPLAYLIDVMFYFGGDFLEITNPTGMYSPRVSVPKKTATCVIQFNNADVLSNPNPRRFLRETLYAGMSDLFDRIAARDKSVNAEAEREKISFLKEDIW